MVTGHNDELDAGSFTVSERHLRVQYEIVSAAASSGDLTEAANRVLRIICGHMGWDVGVIWRIDPVNDSLICLDVWHDASFVVENFENSCRQITYARGQGIPGMVWETGSYVWKNDVSQDSGFLRMRSAEQFGLHAGFGFPIVLAGEIVGVIEFFSRDEKALHRDLLQLLDATSVQIGQLIDRLLAQQALHAAQDVLTRRLAQQVAVADLGRSALQGDDLGKVVANAAQNVAELLECECCNILELLPSGRQLVVKAAVGFSEGSVSQAVIGADKESQAGYTLLVDQLVSVEDLSTETRFKNSKLLLDNGLVSGMSAVIKGHDRPYGVIGVYSRSRRVFNNSDASFLTAVANVVGSAIARKRVEESERRAKLLEQREDFTATLTHDLRGPLLGVNRILELISEGKLGELNDQQKSLLLQIIGTNNGCLSLIQDMLDVFRYEKNIHSLSLVETDVREIIRSSVAELSPLASNRGIDIRVDMPAEFSMAEVDQTSIRRVLQNLLDNAIKFSDNGKQVVVKVWLQDAKIHIAVKDSGPGISQEDSGRLFQRCFQGAAGKNSNRGMGLGLYLCKQIVDAHNGEIKCDSKENIGSTFTVSLPALTHSR